MKKNHAYGNVEVWHKDQWGGLCDDHFGENEGKVVCRMLGYDRVTEVGKI